MKAVNERSTLTLALSRRREGGHLGPLLLALAVIEGIATPVMAEDPAQSLADVDVIERLGDQVPLQIEFKDSKERTISLRDVFSAKRPVVLSLVYLRCPMLCGQVLAGLVRALHDSGLKLGADYRAITVSFDPTETPKDVAPHRRNYLQALGANPEDDNWQFLTGTEANIQALTQALGFRSFYDSSTKQFAHVAAIFVLSPDGKITRYLYGLEFPARDLRLAVVEASQGRVGTTLDRFLLTCYRYDPASRRYAFFVSSFLRTGGLLVFVMLFAALGFFWRKEFKRGQVV